MFEDALPEPVVARPKPDHVGHHEGLRERAAKGGLEGIEAACHEAIEDQVSGSLGYVSGKATRAAALDLKLIFDLTLRIAREPTAKRPVISSWTAMLAYVRVALQHEPREQFRVLYLDKKHQLILDEAQDKGTVDHAPIDPREVVRRALEFSTSALILVHNHPSGDPTPSRADVEITKQVVQAGRALNVEVHDHLVVGRDGVASFKQLGLM